MPKRIPGFRLHRPTGQAVVTLNGVDHYLGRHDRPETRARYDQLVAEWLGNNRLVPTTAAAPGGGQTTITRLAVEYVKHSDQYYRKNGRPTSEAGLVRLSVATLRTLYGGETDLASEFTPLKLKALRQKFIESGLCRNEVNKRVGRIIRAFKWGAENGLVDGAVVVNLKMVAGLRKGRCEAPDHAPVKPVADADVDAVAPHVSRQVWAMIQVQRYTGARPGEVMIMRTADVDTSRQTWEYRPREHKTEHKGQGRIIPIGPKLRHILLPWFRDDPNAYLFQPREAIQELNAGKRRDRKTPVQPSQRSRKKSKPKKTPGELYTVNSYRHAIHRACDKIGIPQWNPHQIRHSFATTLRREDGLDTARAALGHTTPAVTAIYAEADHDKARLAVERVG